eukprot:CAMPEP_0178659466 /NCGR_PEP_ID=MMETSP0698-20121128/26571_1 /TAXON_ID=265572 /ORGANISM="Extubocellulus spinifer, Strain CCMP396" /LENGTH=83 /DNA_ID=CAMNT_0020301987 /DNA_START=495 /DNA_END=750 /DNA_ORIENTATION=+
MAEKRSHVGPVTARFEARRTGRWRGDRRPGGPIAATALPWTVRFSGAGVKDDGANNDLVGCYMVDAVVPNKKLGEIELRPGES